MENTQNPTILIGLLVRPVTPAYTAKKGWVGFTAILDKELWGRNRKFVVKGQLSAEDLLNTAATGRAAAGVDVYPDQ